MILKKTIAVIIASTALLAPAGAMRPARVSAARISKSKHKHVYTLIGSLAFDKRRRLFKRGGLLFRFGTPRTYVKRSVDQLPAWAIPVTVINTGASYISVKQALAQDFTAKDGRQALPGYFADYRRQPRLALRLLRQNTVLAPGRRVKTALVYLKLGKRPRLLCLAPGGKAFGVIR